MTALTDPLGHTTQYTYHDDMALLVERKVMPTLNTNKLSYNNYGQLSQVLLDGLTTAGGNKLTPYVLYRYSNDRLQPYHGMVQIIPLTYDGFGKSEKYQ